MDPFVRAAGSGPSTLICLHSNASTSGQWRGLMDRLSPRFRVLAPDGLGAGRSPPWPDIPGGVRLQHAVELIEPLIASAEGAPLHLVGHSYGGAVALKAALRHRDKVASLTVYEPTAFFLLEQVQRRHPAGAGIRETSTRAAAHVERGEMDAAAEVFIDFWMGPGTWKRMPESRRGPVAESMRPIAGWLEALLEEPMSADDLRSLTMPVLLMVGDRSPIDARESARLLEGALPRVTRRDMRGLGHMAPVTHPDEVNAEIEAFLDRIGA